MLVLAVLCWWLKLARIQDDVKAELSQTAQNFVCNEKAKELRKNGRLLKDIGNEINLSPSRVCEVT